MFIPKHIRERAAVVQEMATDIAMDNVPYWIFDEAVLRLHACSKDLKISMQRHFAAESQREEDYFKARDAQDKKESNA